MSYDNICQLASGYLKCNIDETGNFLNMYPADIYPEDYVRLYHFNRLYLLQEIHRDNIRDIFETEDEALANIALVLKAIRFYEHSSDECIEKWYMDNADSIKSILTLKDALELYQTLGQ